MEDRPADAGVAEKPQTITFDTILPAAIAVRVKASGVQRASLDPVTVSLINIATHVLMMTLILQARTAVHANAPSRPELRLSPTIENP